MLNLNELIETNGSNIEIPIGEHKGPLVIEKPCVINGNKATLWAESSPVLVINSKDVILKNIRIESLSKNRNEPVLISSFDDTVFEEVEVIGDVKGIKFEEEKWHFPNELDLGEFCENDENTFVFEIYSPVPASLHTEIKDIAINPELINRGKNTITITTGKIKNGLFLYGEILIKSNFNRRIYIKGKSVSSISPLKNKELYIYNNIDESQYYMSEEIIKIFTTTPINDKQKNKIEENDFSSLDVKLLNRGERLIISNIINDVIKVRVGYKKLTKPLDLDPYVFLIDENNKTIKDSDLIFFGNEISECKSVKLLNSSNENTEKDILVNFNYIPEYINKVVIAYSIYIESKQGTFLNVQEPYLSVISNKKEIYRYVVNGLTSETTIIMAEFYRYKDSWKIAAIGQGFKNGLKRLCEDFGIIVGD